jgi:hypothetical protein
MDSLDSPRQYLVPPAADAHHVEALALEDDLPNPPLPGNCIHPGSYQLEKLLEIIGLFLQWKHH